MRAYEHVPVHPGDKAIRMMVFPRVLRTALTMPRAFHIGYARKHPLREMAPFRFLVLNKTHTLWNVFEWGQGKDVQHHFPAVACWTVYKEASPGVFRFELS